MKESKLQKSIIDYCKQQKIYIINMYGNGMCGKGTPDLILCIDGVFVAMECKVGNNGLQDDQIIHKMRIRYSKGLWYCPRTIEEAIQIINDIKKGKYV